MSELTSLNILISLYKGYGLGDAVQMSSVLKHVRKYRPHWIIDYQAQEGQYECGRGIVHNVFPYGITSYPTPKYDGEVQIKLYDIWANWTDRPNTRVTSALHGVFDIPWDKELARYEVNVSQSVHNWAVKVIPKKSVAYHYEGVTATDKKNLTDEQVIRIREVIQYLGYHPYKMGKNIPQGYSAEVNCAIISQCDAFIGIDSGPGKCASATDTPSLIIWTGHHPAAYHDPAPNTTHLVPHNYHSMFPVCNHEEVIQWFEDNYKIRKYDPEDNKNLISNVHMWLSEVLK